MKNTTVFTQIGQLCTLEGAVRKQGRHITAADLGIVADAAMVVLTTKGVGRVQWVGRRTDLPREFKKAKHVKLGGRLLVPGFIDSHTHLVFAGDRSGDFEKRLAGATYQTIAAEGGGILRTVRATREASKKELLHLARGRLANALEQGITTLEIKTGYGLDFNSELKTLEVIQALKKISPAQIFSTLLSAHAVPPEFVGRRKDYIGEISERWLPKLKKHVQFVDIFLDAGYFDIEDAEILFEAAKKHKLGIKVHADELALTGGTAMGVKYGALSVDHLLRITDHEVRLLAASGTTATLLPTTAFFLKDTYAPARALLDSGARVALATDYNPGTSPTQDISIVGALAALGMQMTMPEILVGFTLNGAYALGVEASKGALVAGFTADFACLEADSPSQFFYEFGQHRLTRDVYIGGRRCKAGALF
jgi:imidazolonepropionase